MLQIVTGDGGTPYQITLTKNDEPFAIAGTATVKARVVSPHHSTAHTAVIDQPENQLGADWSQGVVGVTLPAAETAGIPIGPAKLEIQVDDGGPLTWHVPVLIVKGTID